MAVGLGDGGMVGKGVNVGLMIAVWGVATAVAIVTWGCVWGETAVTRAKAGRPSVGVGDRGAPV